MFFETFKFEISGQDGADVIFGKPFSRTIQTHDDGLQSEVEFSVETL